MSWTGCLGRMSERNRPVLENWNLESQRAGLGNPAASSRIKSTYVEECPKFITVLSGVLPFDVAFVEVGKTRYAIIASWILDGVDNEPLDNAAFVVNGDRVEVVDHLDTIKARYPEIRAVHRFDGCTLLPGFVNAHPHLTFSGDGSTVEAIMEASDTSQQATSERNMAAALRSGVTTIVDTGSCGDLSFRLRDSAAERSRYSGPRVMVARRPLTSRRGHCWQTGDESSGESEIRARAEQTLASGADSLRVMASGGGTVGMNPFSPQFSLNELVVTSGFRLPEVGFFRGTSVAW